MFLLYKARLDELKEMKNAAGRYSQEETECSFIRGNGSEETAESEGRI